MFKPVVRYYEFRDGENYSLSDICGFIDRVPMDRPFSWHVQKKGLVGVPEVSLFEKKGEVDEVILTKHSENCLRVEIQFDPITIPSVLLSAISFLMVYVMGFFINQEIGTFFPYWIIFAATIAKPVLLFFRRRNHQQEITDYLTRILGLEPVIIK